MTLALKDFFLSSPNRVCIGFFVTMARIETCQDVDRVWVIKKKGGRGIFSGHFSVYYRS